MAAIIATDRVCFKGHPAYPYLNRPLPSWNARQCWKCRASKRCMVSMSSTGELEGQVYLVTGSTDGIGLFTAKKLAKAGGDVIMHGRNPDRLEDAVQAVEKIRSGSSQVHAHLADLSSLAEVRRLAGEIKKAHENIDVLINNAGVYMKEKQISADGFEMTYAVNVLAPFLLTSCLHDIVKSRIVNTASISAGSHVDLHNLNQEKCYSSHDAYSLSKLLDIMFSFELAERMKDQPYTVNTLDPGTVNTKMLLAGWGRIGIEIDEATNELFLATSPSLNGVTGQYFVGKRPSRAPPPAYDLELRGKLWSLWEQQTGAVYTN